MNERVLRFKRINEYQVSLHALAIGPELGYEVNVIHQDGTVMSLDCANVLDAIEEYETALVYVEATYDNQ